MMLKWIWLVITIIIALLNKFFSYVLGKISFNPSQTQTETVVYLKENIPILQKGQQLKVLTYNVQFMAGKNYVFFYDLPDWDGPDKRPSTADINHTITEVARIIKAEDPDVILLQEVDDGATKTDYKDQLACLLKLLPACYCCHTSTFYWQAPFVPHPGIMGAVGQKLSIISKYKINQATRYQLPNVFTDPLVQVFRPKRAMLEATLAVSDGSEFIILTTHPEVASYGAEIKEAEICMIKHHLEKLNQANKPWLIGGDFNLLLPTQLETLPENLAFEFRPQTELMPLLKHFQAIPDIAQTIKEEMPKWYTMFPNNPQIKAPDRTTDYIFFSNHLQLIKGYVRQHDTLAISDHLPLIAEVEYKQ